MNFCVDQESFYAFCGWLKLALATPTRVSLHSSDFRPLTCLAWVVLPGALVPVSIAPLVAEAHKLPYHVTI